MTPTPLERPPSLRSRLTRLLNPGCEPQEQRVRPMLRAASGVLALFILAGVVLDWSDGEPWWTVTGFAVAGFAFGWIAVRGWYEPVIDPEASERFRALADPTRPLPATGDDSAPAPLSGDGALSIRDESAAAVPSESR